jgi:hypothetical protein
MKKIGTSLVRCLASIDAGEVNTDDILYVTVNSHISYATSTLDSLLADLRTRISISALEAFLPIVELLWATGRIYVPLFGVGVREALPMWIDVPQSDDLNKSS